MPKSSAEQPHATSASGTPKALYVLQVDDDDHFLKSSKQILEMQCSFQIDTALSVKEALKKLKQKEYDAVVSDYQMPETDGLDFLKQLRDEGNDIPFILFTGKGREEVAIKALNLGADRYLNKIGHPEAVYGELGHAIENAVKRSKAEKKIVESEAKFRYLFETAPDPIVTANLKGIITSCNTAALKLIGCSKEEFVGKHYFKLNFFRAKDLPKYLKVVDAIANDKRVEPFELTWRTKDGRDILSEVRLSPLKEGGKIVGAQVICRDITERKRAEEKLRESEEKYRNLIENSKDSIAIVDFKGNGLFANKATEKLTGYASEEGIGMNIRKLIPKRLWPKSVALLLKARMGKPIPYFEYELKRKDGTAISVETGGQAIFKDGKPVAIQIITRDITERKRAETMLRQSEEWFRQFFEDAPDYLYVISPEGKILDINKSALTALGYNKEEVIGKPLLSTIYAPSSQKRAKALFMHWKSGGKIRNEELDIVTKTGETKTVLLSVDSVKDAEGRLLHSVSVQRDITEHKKMRTALQESEENYRRMIEHAPDLIVTMDEKGIVTSCNSTLERGTDYSQPEIVGKPFIETPLLHGVDPVNAQKIFNSIIEGKHPDPIELTWFLKDGTPRISEIRIGLMKKDDKIAGFTAVARDITEHKKANEALQKSEKRFRELSELLPEIVFETDASGRLTFANQAGFDCFGYSREDFEKGLKALKMLSAEDRDRGRVNMDTVLNGKRVGPNEYTAVRKDGSKFPIIIHSTPIIHGNKTTGMRGLILDITERKQAEDAVEKIINELSMIIEKLGVVGRLTRHDARNKLSVITNSTYLVKKLLADNREGLKYLRDIESAAEQIEKIFDFSRTYEMLGAEELSYMDVEKSVNEAAILFSGLNGAKLVNESHELKVLADSLLRQVFYNLIDDTLKHGEKVTQIRVHYKEHSDHLKLIYEDDGIGIPKHEKEKIFEEGYGKGTGYGLYLIRKICEAYGWTIQETGVPGKGARFIMVIPKASENGKPSYFFDG